jgi:hypothetical protein
LNNHQDGSLTYYDRPNTLFSGNAEVKDGVFTIQFMLPKDIKYNYGGGRINYYAADNINNKEAQGNFENFVVGGTDKNNVAETDGPGVQMYLNSENFVSGDKVNETPLFIANISDPHGVNTVGSGIGHDVTLTVDEDPSQSYVLNDYFVAKENTGLGKVLENKWYIDELYDAIIVKPVQSFASFLNNVVEKRGIDGFVNGVGKAVNYGSRQVRLLQSGHVGVYVLLMVIGILILFIVQMFL